MGTNQCTADNCSRPAGHEMPHGHEAQPGLVFAPWSDMPRTRPPDLDDPPIPCNSCGEPLVLDPKRATAKCQCGQSISFDERGYTQTILPKLYPEKITDPDMMLEMGQHKVSEWKFFDTLQLQFGLIDESEFSKRRQNAKEVLTNFICDEVEPLQKKKPWWKPW